MAMFLLCLAPAMVAQQVWADVIPPEEGTGAGAHRAEPIGIWAGRQNGWASGSRERQSGRLERPTPSKGAAARPPGTRGRASVQVTDGVTASAFSDAVASAARRAGARVTAHFSSARSALGEACCFASRARASPWTGPCSAAGCSRPACRTHASTRPSPSSKIRRAPGCAPVWTGSLPSGRDEGHLSDGGSTGRRRHARARELVRRARLAPAPAARIAPPASPGHRLAPAATAGRPGSIVEVRFTQVS
jgi:hypothetical protein